MILHRYSKIIPVNPFLLPSCSFPASRVTFKMQIRWWDFWPYSDLCHAAQFLWASHTESLILDLSFPPSKPWTMLLPLFGVLFCCPPLFLTSLLSVTSCPKYHLPKRPPLTQKARLSLPVRSFAIRPVLWLSHFSSLVHCYLPEVWSGPGGNGPCYVHH